MAQMPGQSASAMSESPSGEHRPRYIIKIITPASTSLVSSEAGFSLPLAVYGALSGRKLSNSPSFQRSVDHGYHVIELHAWRSVESCTFTKFTRKPAEQLLRHITGTNENEVIRRSLLWCDKNS